MVQCLCFDQALWLLLCLICWRMLSHCI